MNITELSVCRHGRITPFFYIEKFSIKWYIIMGVAITITVYNFKNATGKNRYSQFDITDSNEEPDLLNERFGNAQSFENSARNTASESAYCPYCGTPVGDGFEFCNRCGKRLP